MNRKIQEALDFCNRNGSTEVVLGVPFHLSHEEVVTLKEKGIVKGMILYCPPPEITANSSNEWLGCFTHDGSWLLPRARGRLVFVGSHLGLTWRMVKQVRESGRFEIFCKINDAYRPLKIYRFLLWRIGERLHYRIKQLSHNSVLRNALFYLAGIPFIKNIWKRFFKREDFTASALPGRSRKCGETLYLEIFKEALAQPDNAKIQPVPGRVLLVNSGLAAGGAERQIVNTLIGLRNSGQCESVALLAEYIDHAPNLDFFLHELVAQGIEVSQVQHAIALSDDGLLSLPSPIAELVADLPGHIVEEMLNLVEEFRTRRPSIVHAWQDSTSIKAGIAAVIAGVPRIVLSSRNVTPPNFAYHQDYMRPAYRALATLGCVTFLNNSDAGAADYTRWLGLLPGRFAVLRNGVDLTYLKRSESAEIASYKRALGIPDQAPVVGSIFRFWAEKRPMLWLEAAAKIAQEYPDAHFLVIGDGPMRPEMKAFILAHGLTDKVHLPGTRPDVALPLSAMNIFMLTSKFEGTPNVILEAQWFGIPVVATDSGGTRESFAQGVTGELAEVADARMIANLALHFLKNPSAQARASRQGPDYVSAQFGLHRMISETLSIYGLSGSGKIESYKKGCAIEQV